jgi:hypothetical protein
VIFTGSAIACFFASVELLTVSSSPKNPVAAAGKVLDVAPDEQLPRRPASATRRRKSSEKYQPANQIDDRAGSVAAATSA